MRTQRTGFYDDTGRAICEYDRIEAIAYDGTLIIGRVLDDDGIWYVSNEAGGWSPDLLNLDSIKILAREQDT